MQDLKIRCHYCTKLCEFWPKNLTHFEYLTRWDLELTHTFKPQYVLSEKSINYFMDILEWNCEIVCFSWLRNRKIAILAIFPCIEKRNCTDTYNIVIEASILIWTSESPYPEKYSTHFFNSIVLFHVIGGYFCVELCHYFPSIFLCWAVLCLFSILSVFFIMNMCKICT